ncbi:MAG: hypothetical protein IIA48_09490 [Bacteroidetes bacterium]|nr:hypothetical protein [Bacteroidota bacterium]
MLVSKEDIKISHYIIGFHSFNKDHNFPKFRGDLINYFESELKLTLEAFNLGREHIVHATERDPELFEIKLTPQVLIYKDVPPLEKMINNSMKFLKYWRTQSKLVNLRLVGLVRTFTINIEPNKDEKHLNIVESFFKDLKYGDKYIASDFSLRFNKELNNEIYNINLKMFENKEPEYNFTGLIDFNKIAPTIGSSLSHTDIHNIFERSTHYFENDFIQLLNE